MKIGLSYMISKVLRGDRYLAKTRLDYMTSKISREARDLAEIRLSYRTSKIPRGDRRIELQETLFSLPMVFFPLGFVFGCGFLSRLLTAGSKV